MQVGERESNRGAHETRLVAVDVPGLAARAVLRRLDEQPDLGDAADSDGQIVINDSVRLLARTPNEDHERAGRRDLAGLALSPVDLIRAAERTHPVVAARYAPAPCDAPTETLSS